MFMADHKVSLKSLKSLKIKLILASWLYNKHLAWYTPMEEIYCDQTDVKCETSVNMDNTDSTVATHFSRSTYIILYYHKHRIA